MISSTSTNFDPPEIPSNRSPQKRHSPIKAAGDVSLSSSSANSSYVYEDSQYRVRRFPATELPDYPSGIPVFRRRSLHPDGVKVMDDGVPDPYEEFFIRSPRIQAQLDAQRIISRVMSDGREETIQPTRMPYTYTRSYSRPQPKKFRLPSAQPLFDLLAYAVAGLIGLLILPFKAIGMGAREFFYLSRFTARLLIFIKR